MPQKLVLDPDGVAITRVDPPLGNLPPGWSYLDDDGRSLGSTQLPPSAIRVITLQAFISRLTPVEVAIMWGSPVLMQTLLVQMAEPGTSTVNLDSPRLMPLLGVANLSAERIAELTVDGDAAEAAR
jgi:hypothetical protein